MRLGIGEGKEMVRGKVYGQYRIRVMVRGRVMVRVWLGFGSG